MEDNQRRMQMMMIDVSILPVPAWLARVIPMLFATGFEHMALMAHDLCAIMYLGSRALCWLRTNASEEGLSHLELVRARDGPLGHTDVRVRFGLLIDLVDASRVRVEVRRRYWAWDEDESETRDTCHVLDVACDTLDANALLRLTDDIARPPRRRRI
jgi:hypothetical protein